MLEAEQCSDLVDAAVLAITLALTPDVPARERAALSPEPASSAPAPESGTSTPGTTALTPTDADPGANEAAEGSAPALGGFLSVGALVEIGALPHSTTGLEVAAGLRRGPLALAAKARFSRPTGG